MKIRYKKKQTRLNLFFGLLWLVNGFIQTVFNDAPKWYDYFWFLLSAAYLITYLYQKQEKYLTIKDGIIKQNWPFGKSIRLEDIKNIKSFAGDLIIRSETGEIRVYNDLTEEASKNELTAYLKTLNIHWE